MKRIKKFASLMLAIVMVLAMAIPGMTAKAAGDKQITIKPSATVPITEKSQFAAYKILDAKAVGTSEVAYTVPEGMKNFYCTRYKLTGDEKDFARKVVDGINAETDKYAFADAAVAAAKTAGIAGVTGSVNGENYVISGLEVGYYAIEDQNGDPVSQVILDTTTENLEVTLKADAPPLDKKIDGKKDTDPNTNGLVDQDNASVGDTVPYVVKTKVPSMAGYDRYKFVITDTMSKGLTLIDDNDTGFVITIGGGAPLTRGTDYKIEKTDNTDESTTIVITFVEFYAKNKDKAGQDIEVRYSAILNDDAVIGELGNPNSAKLEYSNHPSHVGTGDSFGDDDRKGNTPESTVYTYATALQLLKVNAANEKLPGAEFTLKGDRLNRVHITGTQYVEDADGTYYKLKEGTYTEQAPADANDDRYDSATVKYALKEVNGYVDTTEHVTATAVTGTDGKLVFKGLAAGTYTITEIKAPDGYNMLSGPITVTIGCTYDKDKSVWSGSYTLGDETKDLTFNGDSATIEGLEIVNNTGTELPSTGGIGTTIFYIVGAILVIGAGVILVAKKRMSTER